MEQYSVRSIRLLYKKLIENEQVSDKEIDNLICKLPDSYVLKIQDSYTKILKLYWEKIFTHSISFKIIKFRDVRSTIGYNIYLETFINAINEFDINSDDINKKYVIKITHMIYELIIDLPLYEKDYYAFKKLDYSDYINFRDKMLNIKEKIIIKIIEFYDESPQILINQVDMSNFMKCNRHYILKYNLNKAKIQVVFPNGLDGLCEKLKIDKYASCYYNIDFYSTQRMTSFLSYMSFVTKEEFLELSDTITTCFFRSIIIGNRNFRNFSMTERFIPSMFSYIDNTMNNEEVFKLFVKALDDKLEIFNDIKCANIVYTFLIKYNLINLLDVKNSSKIMKKLIFEKKLGGIINDKQ